MNWVSVADFITDERSLRPPLPVEIDYWSARVAPRRWVRILEHELLQFATETEGLPLASDSSLESLTFQGGTTEHTPDNPFADSQVQHHTKPYVTCSFFI